MAIPAQNVTNAISAYSNTPSGGSSGLNARDAADEMAERGVGYAFHLERPGHRGLQLVVLAQDAGLVVTEDLPTPPMRAWNEALGKLGMYVTFKEKKIPK